ncbi:putative p-type calcium atpase [Phaeomoniella chlamydospora]|uniref:Calcium-transporting ATPase n=1 Tax=Phaeomoniella chlamydospora TaxID=158046 RepID=A0A0G2F1I8_PHACM|nr:putative p-type calcium atpase [Phaeomoniella chlamydospora]
MADDQNGKASNNNEGVINDETALVPDPSTESDFEVEDNKFAFSPGQLNKLINPKSLSAFHALGGLTGIEKGLRTNRHSGLSVDETTLDGTVSFEDSVKSGVEQAETDMKPVKRTKTSDTMGEHVKGSDKSYYDRKRIFKDNRLPEKKPKTIWELAWMAYNDKVLILLTVAAVISLALGIYQSVQPADPHEARVEWVEGVAIIVAIVIVVVVGALNDYQKERQFVKLNKKKEERFVKVIRSGMSREISIYDVLVGDVMHLEPGDLIPVDGIFIEGHNVKCDESSATGESDILSKTSGDEVMRAIEHHEKLSKMDPFILSGGKVQEGVGTFLVTSVGVNSSYGKILMSLQDQGQTTPLQSKLNVLAEYIAKLGLAAGLLLFVVTFIKFLAQLKDLDGAQAKGQAFLQIFIVSVTVVVVAVPEGLPLAVTLALAFATTRMLKDNNLVRLLRACETMGNATTVCSDKTGTLTQNKMTVVAGTLGTSSRFNDRQKVTSSTTEQTQKNAEDVESDDVSPTEFTSTLAGDVKQLLKDSITLNSTAFEAEEEGRVVFIGSKTETAMLHFAKDFLGMTSVSEDRSNAEIVQMVPFDSGRKCMAVVVKLANGKYRMLVKGASEILIARCSRIIRDPTKDVTDTGMTEQNMRTLSQLIQNYASHSLRTIGVIYRDFESWPPRGAPTLEEDRRQAKFDKVFKDMTFLGIVGIQDPLRPGVTDAVRDCIGAGVFVRMVTGDNLTTAKAIALECGIFTKGGVAMEGPAFRKLSKNQMNQIIPRLQVLARSSPQDKEILVKHLKKLGETVAVTGDGTNDAPALKSADVGFSMGIAGTEVAKEASAIILMDDNFASIFQITVNITAVFLTFVSAVASGSEESVLTAVQLLWVNLIMDTFAALALATDAPSPSLLKRRPEPKSAPLITLTMWKMIIGQSIYQLVVTFILNFAGKAILNYDSSQNTQLKTLVFNTFVWMQIFNQYNSRRLDNKFNIFEGMFRNYWFLGIQFIIVGGQVLIIFVGGAAFSVTELDGAQWGISLILGLLSVPVAIIIRLIPDEFIRTILPRWHYRKSSSPKLFISDEEAGQQEWNPALEEIREELTFLKKVRGGRMAGLAYKLQHPRETLMPRSRSPSTRSRSNSSLPRTPEGEPNVTELTSNPPTPDSRARRRTRSNSGFGPAAAMVGIIAGGIAGGFSPIEGRPSESDSLRWTRSRAHSGLDNQPGIELHPDTDPDDPIIAELPLTGKIPPSQNPDLAPRFDGAPPVPPIPHIRSSPSRGRRSHSRHSSATANEHQS